MANLQKVVKVTQAQYDVLASGGTVGGYTGLDDNYIYLIEDNNEYLPITGGSIINNGTVIFRNGNASSSERFELNGAITHDDYSIIYLPNNYGHHSEDISLLGDNSGAIIYSVSDDYHSDVAINSDRLILIDHSNDGYDMRFNPNDHSITYTDDTTTYTATLPNETGTLALQSYVQANPANPTTPLSSIQIGNTKYIVSSANYYPTEISWTNGTTAGPTGTMTMSGTSNISIPAIPAASATQSGVVTTGAQTFAGNKTFTDNVKVSSTGSTSTINFQNSYVSDGYFRLDGYWFQTNKGFHANSTDGIISGGPVKPSATNSKDLGSSDRLWRYTYTVALKDGNNANYSLLLPTTTSWTENKTIATTDQLPQVKRFI